jgi:hypothetical protein
MPEAREEADFEHLRFHLRTDDSCQKKQLDNMKMPG